MPRVRAVSRAEGWARIEISDANSSGVLVRPDVALRQLQAEHQEAAAQQGTVAAEGGQVATAPTSFVA